MYVYIHVYAVPKSINNPYSVERYTSRARALRREQDTVKNKKTGVLRAILISFVKHILLVPTGKYKLTAVYALRGYCSNKTDRCKLSRTMCCVV